MIFVGLVLALIVVIILENIGSRPSGGCFA
jgi:hypothetical protein